MTLLDLREAIEQAIPLWLLFVIVGSAWLTLFVWIFWDIGGDE